MSDPSDSPLSAFQKDVEALAQDMEELAEDISEDSRLIGEEMVGAEILATRELIEYLGVTWETLDEMNDVFLRQLRHLAQDHADSAREFLADPGLAQFSAVVLSHCQRRIEHISEGVSQASHLVVRGGDNVTEVLFGLWKPFFAVINRDWQGKRKVPD
jgi:hypothetical protein